VQANGKFGVKPSTGTFAAEPRIGRWADQEPDDAGWPELISARPKAAAKASPNGKTATPEKAAEAKPIEVKLHPVLSEHQNMTQHLIDRASAVKGERPALHPVLKSQQDKTNELIKSLLQES
jgi:hypothetical protein